MNTPVRKNGLLIGRVTEIEDLDNGVIAKVDIDGDRRLLTSHVPHVRTSVLGDATIDFVSEPTAETSAAAFRRRQDTGSCGSKSFRFDCQAGRLAG